jgi:hypothetical protein
MTKPRNRDAQGIAFFLVDHSEYLKSKDLRVGQFISNVAQFMGFNGDPFYIENDALLSGMRQYVIEMQKSDITKP